MIAYTTFNPRGGENTLTCTYLGSEILRTEKIYLGSEIDGKLTYLGSEIFRAKSNYLGSRIGSRFETLKEQIIT